MANQVLSFEWQGDLLEQKSINFTEIHKEKMLAIDFALYVSLHVHLYLGCEDVPKTDGFLFASTKETVHTRKRYEHHLWNFLEHHVEVYPVMLAMVFPPYAS